MAGSSNAMLKDSSSAARSMTDRKPAINSAMTAAMNTRRNMFSAVEKANPKAANSDIKEAINNANKESHQQAVVARRDKYMDKLRDDVANKKVVSLLERILVSLDSKDRGPGLGNMIASGGVGLLGRLSSTMEGGALRKVAGRWRNIETGRFAKAPVGMFARGFNAIRGSAVGRAIGAVAESPIGRGVGKVASIIGRGARSPLGRIAGQGLRIGGNVLGKFALPITAALAVMDGVNGMRHADDILGRKTNLRDKASVGVAEAVNGALFGLPNLISKHVFGESFSKLMVDDLGNIGKKVSATITNTIDNAQKMLGAGLGSISSVMGGAFSSFTDYAKEVSDAGTALITAVKNRDMQGAIAALGMLGKLLVKGVTAPGKAIVKTAENIGEAGATAVASTAKTIGSDIANSGVGKAVASVVRQGAGFAGAGIGAVSAMFESGKAGAGTVSKGKGDHGGASYGTFQLASAGGAKSTLNKFLESSGYAKQFAGLTPGTDAFDKKWKELAKSDPKFGQAQEDFIKKTHYDPQMAKLKKDGFDLTGRGKAVQEAVFSTSVQYGGNTGVIEKALKGKDLSKMSDKDVVSAIQDYKAAHVNEMFKSSNDNVRAGVAKRIATEKAVLIKDASLPASASGMQVSGSMASASMDKQPLSEELPADQDNNASSNQNTPPAAATSTSTTNTNSSGADISFSNGGVPGVSDVADRPRIDLQAVSTTLPGRN